MSRKYINIFTLKTLNTQYLYYFVSNIDNRDYILKKKYLKRKTFVVMSTFTFSTNKTYLIFDTTIDNNNILSSPKFKIKCNWLKRNVCRGGPQTLLFILIIKTKALFIVTNFLFLI